MYLNKLLASPLESSRLILVPTGMQYFETRSYDSSDFQHFLKYCKTEFGRKNFPVENLRYMVSPEYGERYTRRPHMHCILINCPHEFAVFLQHAWKNGIIKRS